MRTIIAICCSFYFIYDTVITYANFVYLVTHGWRLLITSHLLFVAINKALHCLSRSLDSQSGHTYRLAAVGPAHRGDRPTRQPPVVGDPTVRGMADHRLLQERDFYSSRKGGLRPVRGLDGGTSAGILYKCSRVISESLFASRASAERLIMNHVTANRNRERVAFMYSYRTNVRRDYVWKSTRTFPYDQCLTRNPCVCVNCYLLIVTMLMHRHRHDYMI